MYIILSVIYFYPICLAVIIAEKRARVQKELNEIDELYTKREEQDENDDDGEIITESHGSNVNQVPEEESSLSNEKEGEEVNEDKKDIDNVSNSIEFEPIYDE